MFINDGGSAVDLALSGDVLDRLIMAKRHGSDLQLQYHLGLAHSTRQLGGS